MNPHAARARRFFRTLLLAAAALPLSGCVVWDIRDEMRGTNTRLDRVEQGLATTNAELTKVQDGLKRLDTTNTLIDGVEKGLVRIDDTNSSLSGVKEQLGLLRSMDKSMTHLDAHLSSLRTTLGRIDGMIPFLDLGTSDPAADAGANAPTDANAEAPADAKPAASAPASGQAPARRDGLLGTWISQYPDRTTVLILLDAGRYARQAGDRATVETGTWTRDGKRLRLTPDAQVTPSTQPPATPGSPTQAAPTTPAPAEFEILGQTARSITVRSAGGGILVFVKPS
jgi:pyruvate/2-oxoglutarate dehydrogenase complex dihydrolipoamide acyltransferase (E2) component